MVGLDMLLMVEGRELMSMKLLGTSLHADVPAPYGPDQSQSVGLTIDNISILDLQAGT